MKNINNMGLPSFTYAFQPIVDVVTGKAFSYEALIRGKNNEPPNFIFSQINDSKLVEFDQLARNSAIKLATDLGINCNLNLNFLPRCMQYSDKYITETLIEAKKFSLPVERLIVEVTEEQAIIDKKTFTKCVNICRKLGVQVSLDDFGAGHSNLNLLVELVPDQIKLDMYLVRGIDSNGPRQVIVKAVVDVCTALGIDVIAEGVETIDEYFWLKQHDIFLFQGFLFAKPGFEILPEYVIPQDKL